MRNEIMTGNASMDMFQVMEKALRFAEIISKSDIIPSHYKGKTENVFIAVQTAYRMNMDPMLIMQNTYVVSGKLGMSAQFAIALANNSGLFIGGIRYKIQGTGADLSVTAYTNLKGTNEEISYTVSMKMAHAENWTKNAKYQTMPELMLRYRSAAFLIRTHAPQVINGMHMVEELEDVSIASSTTPIQNVADSVADNLINRISALQVSTPITQEVGMIDLASQLTNLIMEKNVPNEVVDKWLIKAAVNNIVNLDNETLQKCIDHVNEKY